MNFRGLQPAAGGLASKALRDLSAWRDILQSPRGEPCDLRRMKPHYPVSAGEGLRRFDGILALIRISEYYTELAGASRGSGVDV